MNIGIFTDTYYPEINGVANSAYQLKKELEARGNNVYVFTVSNPKMRDYETHVFRISSIPLVLLKDRRIGCTTLGFWYKVIKNLNLDVIHTQTEFTVGHIGRKVARKLGIPLIHTYHTIYEDYTHYLRIPGNQKLRGTIRSLSRVCCDHADIVVVPTKKVKNLLISYGVKKNIVVQPTGVDLAKFQNVEETQVERLREQYGLKHTDHVLISIGRLSKEKSIDEIIALTEKIRQTDQRIKLVIVGNGPEEKILKKIVIDRQLDNCVIFTGAVNWSEIQNYYALGNVFVSASTSETQGLTYVEALASGKPLLVKKDECLNEILEYGKNGYSFTTDSEFISNYQKFFEANEWTNMNASAVDAAKHISSSRFGYGIEQIYMDALKAEKEGQTYEKIHAVAG
ncbi:MAG: glycosyltransferase family 4 protein [Lachnospiraceae bacterium]|nr:glycosyltransferase family 4 protein [Lachnospiraceae bacterium]